MASDLTATGARSPAAVRRMAEAALRAPVCARTWREVLYWLASLPVSAPGFLVSLVLIAAGTGLTLTVAGAVLGVLLLAAGLGLARVAGEAQRALAGRLLGLRLPRLGRPQPGTGVLGRVEARFRDPTRWRAAGYLGLRFPLAFAGLWLMAVTWGYGLFFLTYPIWWTVAHRQATGPHPTHGLAPILTPFPAGGAHIGTLGEAFALLLPGIVVLLVAPWVTRGLTAADSWLLRRVLCGADLAGRVRQLEAARALAVDDAAARLRRVERDLHDGAQARLVALAMTLGMAREKLDPDARGADAERARELVDAAHASAKLAITELRDLARGLHPPVLDNGLPGALASLTAGSAVPVAAFVDVPERPTLAIEAMAYFCAAELIANVGKHSGADNATLEMRQHERRLRLRVFDDGHGGARTGRVGGLAGLAERIQTVDGSIEVDSPAGGPTTVVIELPMHA
ncbi:MAG TPA: sensor domain-containing protein [Streptosporangiaceae bacterium]